MTDLYMDAHLLVDHRPALCRERLRDEGKPYPKSGCAVCKTGGLTGCHYKIPKENPAWVTNGDHKFHPAYDTPTTLEQAIAVIEAWSDPGCYTFSAVRADACAKLLRKGLSEQNTFVPAPANL